MSQVSGVTCHNCGYNWEYSGENEIACCPNCLFKTPVETDDSAPDPIRVAGDDGEVLDATDDGAIACVEDGDGLLVHVDPDSELGELLEREAVYCNESTDELLADAIQQFIDRERRKQRARTTTCEHCGERFDVNETRGTFDGDIARYVCPHCSEGTSGPLPPFGER